jgi:hypothetical protein
MWSKLKQTLEGRLAPSLAGRLEYHAAAYHYAHDEDGRVWLTLDKRELASLCDFPRWGRHEELERQVLEANGLDYRDCELAAGARKAADEEAVKLRHREAVYGRWEFYEAAHQYLGLSVEDALRSDNGLVLALAVLDRRLGKRRLRGLRLSASENDLVRTLLDVRLRAEGMEPPAAAVRDAPAARQARV